MAGIARPHKDIEQPVECMTRLPHHDAERNGTLDERVPPKFLYGGENQEVIKMSTKTRSLSQTVLLFPHPVQITGITGDTGYWVAREGLGPLEAPPIVRADGSGDPLPRCHRCFR